MHAASRDRLSESIAAGDELALAPQVLAEFVHVVTDSRRFSNPLETAGAIAVAEQWWMSQEVRPVFPADVAARWFLAWMRQHSLGRKRLLDTLLAATYRQAGVSSLMTTNPADFTVFGCFQCVTP